LLKFTFGRRGSEMRFSPTPAIPPICSTARMLSALAVEMTMSSTSPT
jgi:hypothetical protein